MNNSYIYKQSLEGRIPYECTHLELISELWCVYEINVEGSKCIDLRLSGRRTGKTTNLIRKAKNSDTSNKAKIIIVCSMKQVRILANGNDIQVKCFSGINELDMSRYKEIYIDEYYWYKDVNKLHQLLMMCMDRNIKVIGLSSKLGQYDIMSY